MFQTKPVNRKFDSYLLGFMLIMTIGSAVLLSQVPSRMILYLVTGLMCGLSLYIYYLIYAIRNLTYGVNDEGISIYYGYKKILISWSQISGVEKLSKAKWIKFAGSEWPGNYTGYFKEIGKNKLIAAYATSNKDMIIIDTPGLKYAINPEDSQTFMEAVNARIGLLTIAQGWHNVLPANSLWRSGPGRWMLILNAAAILAVAVIIQTIAGRYEQIPMHYNIQGNIDRYGSPYELYFMLSGPAIVLPIIIYVSSKLHQAGVKEAPGYLWIPVALTIFMGLVMIGLVW